MNSKSTTTSLRTDLEKLTIRPVNNHEKRGLSYYLPIVLLITLFMVIIAEISNAF